PQIGGQVRNGQDRPLGLVQRDIAGQRDAQNLLDLAQGTVREMPAPFPHRHRVAGDADAAGKTLLGQAPQLTPLPEGGPQRRFAMRAPIGSSGTTESSPLNHAYVNVARGLREQCETRQLTWFRRLLPGGLRCYAWLR